MNSRSLERNKCSSIFLIEVHQHSGNSLRKFSFRKLKEIAPFLWVQLLFVTEAICFPNLELSLSLLINLLRKHNCCMTWLSCAISSMQVGPIISIIYRNFETRQGHLASLAWMFSCKVSIPYDDMAPGTMWSNLILTFAHLTMQICKILKGLVTISL